jgi:N-acetyl-anhydromuramyl-L-alanine amidase AmpD
VVKVWALLAVGTVAIAAIGWLALPKDSPALVPASGAPRNRAALEALVWPKEMVPARRWHYIVIHHTATVGATLESLDQGHRERGFVSGIAYHFVINNGRTPGTIDGQISPTPRWIEQLDGAHTKVKDHPEFNTEGIGICLVGNFEQTEPTPAQMAALEILTLALRDRYEVPLERIVGHGEVKNTQCPGRKFPMDAFLLEVRRAYLKERIQVLSTEAE